MIRVKNYVAPSKLHGLGLFAGEDIKKGQLITQWHPAAFVRFTAEIMNSLPPIAREFIMHYGTQVEDGGRYYLDWDNVRFMNHSENPNIAYRDAIFDGVLKKVSESYALRDIAKDEEITCDYRKLYSPDHWAWVQKEIREHAQPAI